VRNHAKAGKDENIDFGVPEESEQVLVKNRVSPTCRIEEGGI